MTKTLADELTRLADLIGAVWGGDDSISGEEIEGNLRTLAARCAGKVLARPNIHRFNYGGFKAVLLLTHEGQEGTDAEILQQMQALLDQQEAPSPSTTPPAKEADA